MSEKDGMTGYLKEYLEIREKGIFCTIMAASF